MTRDLKPQVVGRVTSTTTKETVEIMLDRNKNIFFATVNGKRYTQPVFNDLHTEIANALKASYKPVWIPVIHIETQGANRSVGSDFISDLSLSIDRFFICSVPQAEGKDKIFVTRWKIEEEHRQTNMNESYSLNSAQLPQYRQGSAFIPYDEKVWEGLLNICSTIKDAAKELDKLLQEDGPALLINDNCITVQTVIYKRPATGSDRGES